MWSITPTADSQLPSLAYELSRVMKVMMFGCSPAVYKSSKIC